MNVFVKNFWALSLLLVIPAEAGIQDWIPGRARDDKNRPVRIIINSVPESLDPRYSDTEVATHLSQLVYAPLFLMGDDLLPRPYLAEKIEQIEPLVYRIKLRDGLYFHDGRKLKAGDVVYTVQTSKSDKIKMLDSVLAVSDTVVEFRLKKPFSPIVSELANIRILPKGQSRDGTIGSGPYKLVHHDKAKDTWEFEAFERWFEGKPKLNKFEVAVVRDGNTRLLELIKGKADLSVGNIRPFQLPALEKYRSQLTVYSVPGLGYMYLAMNLRKKPLSDIRVRRAIAMSLDLELILKAKFGVMATRATGLLPPGHWAKDSGLPLIPYDLVEARKLIKQTGLKLPIKLQIITTPDRFRQSFALIYKQQLQKIGIELDVRIQDYATAFQNIKQGNFDIVSAMWTPVTDPNLFDWVFHSSNIPGADKAGGNRVAFIDAKIDAWIEAAQLNFNPTVRRMLYGKIERRLLESLPYVPLWFEDNITVISSRLKGFIPDREGSFLPLTKAYVE